MTERTLPIGTMVDEIFLEYGVFHWAGLSPGSTPNIRSSNSFGLTARWLPFLLSNGNTANTQSLVYTSALELEMYGDDFFKDSDAGNANTLWHEAGRLDRKVAENGGFWGPFTNPRAWPL